MVPFAVFLDSFWIGVEDDDRVITRPKIGSESRETKSSYIAQHAWLRSLHFSSSTASQFCLLIVRDDHARVTCPIWPFHTSVNNPLFPKEPQARILWMIYNIKTASLSWITQQSMRDVIHRESQTHSSFVEFACDRHHSRIAQVSVRSFPHIWLRQAFAQQLWQMNWFTHKEELPSHVILLFDPNSTPSKMVTGIMMMMADCMEYAWNVHGALISYQQSLDLQSAMQAGLKSVYCCRKWVN